MASLLDFVVAKENIDSVNELNETPLIRAALEGHDIGVDMLAVAGANVNLKDKDGMNALMHLAYRGSLNGVLVMLACDCEVNEQDRLGRTALSYAADRGHEAIVEELIKSGAKADLKDKHQRTALYYASTNGHEHVATILLNNGGGKIDDKTGDGRNALHSAVEQGLDKLITSLLNTGIDLDAGDKNDKTVLMLAAENIDIDIVRLLKIQGASDLKKDIDGNSAFAIAAQCGADEVVKFLFSDESSIDAKNKNGQTPLMLAAKGKVDARGSSKPPRGVPNYPETVKFLLEKGAGLESQDSQKRTPLVLAVESGQESIVQILLLAGANSAVMDEKGRTLLTLASLHDQENILKLLVKSGLKPNADDLDIPKIKRFFPGLVIERPKKSETIETKEKKAEVKADEEPEPQTEKVNLKARNSEGQTPLILAALQGDVALTEKLIKHGFKPDIKDFKGNTALILAAANGHIDCVKLLLKYEADLEVKNGEGYSAIFLATLNAQIDIVQVLADAGANLGHKVKGANLLMLAAGKGDLDMVMHLIKLGLDPSLKDYTGRTALSFAQGGNHRKVSEYLFKLTAENQK